MLALGSHAAAREDSPESSAKDEIRRRTRDFVDGFNSADLKQMMRLYADTYLDVNLKHPVQSKKEREAYDKAILDRKDTKVEVDSEEIVVSGAHAFTRGRIVVFRTVAGEQEPRRSELRYIDVWQKFPDGWKAIWGIDAELYPDSQ